MRADHRSRGRAGAKKVLAASFVVTFAGACDSSKSSQPPVAPTIDVGSAPAPSAAPAGASTAPSASAAPSAAAGGAAADGGAVAALPPAPPFGHVVKQGDGTCMWMADRPPAPRMVNGRRFPLNPPAPHKVQCPPDDGGS